ncbi:MAG: carboxypeptidase regulatory-like domain-containing protein [candidate division Zixibacteria bacterium]|nr:carboxypeptidase regulatory-like domain-containing protein [candidate division Zixibacteria bacterium]
MLKNCLIWFLGLLLILSIIASCAKKPAVIKGTVTDEKGEPLGGAAIFSVPQRYSTLTDTLGQFSIEGVESGQYAVLAKLGEDSSLVNLGLIEPGQVLVTNVVIQITPPPPPEPEKPKDKPKPKPKAKTKPKPKKEVEFIDPILKNGEKLLLLSDKEYVKQFEIESSDDLVWEFRDIKISKLKFAGGRMYEGYFSGPSSKYYETAARRCIYDNKAWIYTHGPEQTPEEGREIYITIPLGLPGNVDIDSMVVFYMFPRFPEDASPGSIKFRMVGETASGGISILLDWQKIDHSANGQMFHKPMPTLGDNRKIQYLSLEINSDGNAVWDAFLIRPIVYFSVK